MQFGTGPRDHFELNSDLLFSKYNSIAILSPRDKMFPLGSQDGTGLVSNVLLAMYGSLITTSTLVNHSCSPTAYVDLSSKLPEQWCVRTTPAGLKAGEAITFFYPSTEWDMAQGFDCACGYDVSLRLFLQTILTVRDQESMLTVPRLELPEEDTRSEIYLAGRSRVKGHGQPAHPGAQRAAVRQHKARNTCSYLNSHSGYKI